MAGEAPRPELVADTTTPGTPSALGTLTEELPLTELTAELGSGAGKTATVVSTAGFPGSGAVIVGTGATQERIAYETKTATTFTNMAPKESHAIGSLCSPGELTLSQAPPKSLTTPRLTELGLASGQFHVLIGSEFLVLTVAAEGTTKLEIKEASVEGSTRAAHPAGSEVVHLLTRDALLNLCVTNVRSWVAEAPGNLALGASKPVNWKQKEGTEEGEDNLVIGSEGAQTFAEFGKAWTTAFGNIILIAGTTALTTGSYNVLIGREAGTLINTGANNIAIGHHVLSRSATTQSGNVAIGGEALEKAQTSGNVAVGFKAGFKIELVTSEKATVIGHEAGFEDSEKTATKAGSLKNVTMIGWQAQSRASNCITLGSATTEGRQSMILGGVPTETAKATLGKGRGVFAIRNAVTAPTEGYNGTAEGEGVILYAEGGHLWVRVGAGVGEAIKLA